MSSRSTTVRWAAALPVAAALLLSAGASPAFADDHNAYSVELRQDLPRTSTTNDDGAPQKSPDQCPGIPEGMDGWHFVLPGNQTHFVKLTVTFEPGGEQVLTKFGPPSDKHAYVASTPGAELTSVTAEVEGGKLELFNLSHTCPSDTVPGPDESSSDEPTDEPSQKPTDEPSEQPTKPGASETPSNGPSDSSSEEAAASPSPNGGNDGDLAETGSGTPVAALTAGAAALLGAGGYLVLRRRRATASQD